MAIENFWTRNETTILIDLWKSCPVLYDSSMENYINNQVRNQTMDYIVRELEKVGIRKTVIQVRKKMRTLQSQLCRERKKKRLAEDFEPILWCFNELSFIWPSSLLHNAYAEQDISSDSSDSRTKNSGDVKKVQPMHELEIKWTHSEDVKEVEPMEELETEDIKWTKSETTILIDLWKSCPVLYNSSMTNYNNMKVRSNTIAGIVKELEKVGIHKTAIQVKKKVRTLQSQLCREKKKKRLDQDYEPTLWCFNELSFLSHSSFSPNATKNDFGEVYGISSISSGSRIKNILDEVKPMEELETEETVQTSISYSSNDNLPLKSYKQNKEVNKVANDSREVNKNNLVKEYIESLSEFDEGETPLYHPIRNDTFLKSTKKKEITHMIEVPTKANSTTIVTNIQSRKKLEERQEAFCKFLAIELKQITNDDLFDELKLEILQLVSKKMKHQSNILPEDHPININDYISFIS